MDVRRNGRRSCNTCRTRKIGCDEKRPACTQCLLTRHQCASYYQALVFVDPGRKSIGGSVSNRSWRLNDTRGDSKAYTKLEVPNNHKSTSGKPRVPAIKYSISSNITTNNLAIHTSTDIVVDHFTPDHRLSLVSRSNVTIFPAYICGAWVGVLPHLVAQSSHRTNALIITLGALSTAIAGTVSKDSSLVARSRSLYGDALRSLHDELYQSRARYGNITLATSMCLALTELMLGTSSRAWSSHTQGVSQLMEIHGPQNYASGIGHQLFLGFRIFVQLITLTAVLPSLIERLDKLLTGNRQKPHAEAEEIQSELYSLLLTLEAWEDTFSTEYEGLLSWPVLTNLWELHPNSTNAAEESIFPTSLYFPNITVANTITHYWSFTAVILSSLMTIHTFLQNYSPVGFLSTSQYSPEFLQTRNLDLASKICQSMEYLLQKDMKLYGPTSTFYPLSVAQRVFKEAGIHAQRQYDFCRRITGLLIRRGFMLAELLDTRF
ncbi:hypothetical protein F5884DRAFT_874888 [Xylogone sp. PMI_703]|nr:hypothetical protein F5884DRAFT_874888 [Xylogone sp. PMI_703]